MRYLVLIGIQQENITNEFNKVKHRVHRERRDSIKNSVNYLVFFRTKSYILYSGFIKKKRMNDQIILCVLCGSVVTGGKDERKNR